MRPAIINIAKRSCPLAPDPWRRLLGTLWGWCARAALPTVNLKPLTTGTSRTPVRACARLTLFGLSPTSSSARAEMLAMALTAVARLARPRGV